MNANLSSRPTSKTKWSRNLRFSTFGPERCFLPMTLTGAIKEDVSDMIKYCVIYVLPVTDLSGRGILYYSPGRRRLDKFPREKEARALFYILDTLATHPFIRRSGYIGIADYRDVDRSQISYQQQRHMRQLFECMPLKMRSMHICHPSPVMYYVGFPILKHVLGRAFRLRTRLHYGTEAKILNDLGKCGIPRKCLPTDLGGLLTIDVKQWVADRSIIESSLAIRAADAISMKAQLTSSDRVENKQQDSNDLLLRNLMEVSGSSVAPVLPSASCGTTLPHDDDNDDCAASGKGKLADNTSATVDVDEAKNAIFKSFAAELNQQVSEGNNKDNGDVVTMAKPMDWEGPSHEHPRSACDAMITDYVYEQSKQVILDGRHLSDDLAGNNSTVADILTSEIPDDLFD